MVCGKYIEKDEDCKPYKNRFVHTMCFNSLIEASTAIKKGEVSIKEVQDVKRAEIERKQGLSEEEFAIKTAYFNKLKSLTGLKQLTVKIFKLTEDYIKKYNMTYEGLLNSLKYFYDIKENVVTGDVVGIIPYVYDEANVYFQDLQQIKINNEKNIPKLKNINSIVSVKITPTTPKQIDMDKI